MLDRVRSIAVVPSRARGRAGVHLSILLAAFFLAACSGVVDESGRSSQDKTTSQTQDNTTSLTQDNTTSLTSEASNREGAGTAQLAAAAVVATGAGTNLAAAAVGETGAGTAHLVAAAVVATGPSTISVRLLPNEPVKEIAAREVLLAGGSPLEPILEIAGQDDPATVTAGRIVICKLVLRKVDARELVAVNVAIKSLSAVNTFVPLLGIVDPAPLDIVLDPDLLVDCGRGGTAVLALGVESLELGDLQAETGQGPTAAVNTEGREGVRLNQLRILGPPGAEGFIETLVLERSSVFGRIELRNLQIKELVLDSVTVQN